MPLASMESVPRIGGKSSGAGRTGASAVPLVLLAAAAPPTNLPRTPLGATELASRMREAVGKVTYREISDRTGTNHETVRRYFATGKPSIAFLAAFCGVYKIRADWLLTGVGSLHRAAEVESGGRPERGEPVDHDNGPSDRGRGGPRLTR